MQRQYLDSDWYFKPGTFSIADALRGEPGRKVSLPHDAMIEMTPSEDAPAKASMGYHTGSIASYTKFLNLPEDWADDVVYLGFDGVMNNAWTEVDGSRVNLHHYGYTPYYVDLTPHVAFGGGEENMNRITVTANTTMQPNSRWYSGTGVYRHAELLHGPKVHVAPDGIFARTERIETNTDGTTTAFLLIEADIENAYLYAHMASVSVTVAKEDGSQAVTRSVRIEVPGNGRMTARLKMRYDDPILWNAENPALYTVTAAVTDLGKFSLKTFADTPGRTDEETVLFGIRTITVDPVNGLKINGESVLLKGGCVHHDNGILGAVSVFDAEWRKIEKLKSLGFNAIRTAHNPPSKALLEVCDRLGVYVIDEAFDAWAMEKQPGDYNQYFDKDWEQDVEAYIRRDRNHPSVIIWSTGNEIPERGGLSDGYLNAAAIAEKMRSLDTTRPLTNALCTFWNGLPDGKQTEVFRRLSANSNGGGLQNAAESTESDLIENYSESYVMPLDIVGYNYMDEFYEKDGKLYPERVIIGTETFPMMIDTNWALVKKLPYVVGDFTWTCYDYLGEAGIGKSVFVPKDSDMTEAPSHISSFPWRHANDSDFDINGNLMAQGAYRSIVWGSDATYIYAQDPAHFGEKELISRWGWPELSASYTWPGFEGKPVKLTVYSAAEEVELLINGVSQGRKPAGEAQRFTAEFDVIYTPGEVKAISYRDGAAVSENTLFTTGAVTDVRVVREEKHCPLKDGQYLFYLQVELVDAEGRVVPYAKEKLSAEVTGEAAFAAFGSGNPKSADNFASGTCESYRGRALLIVRSEKETPVFDVSIRRD